MDFLANGQEELFRSAGWISQFRRRLVRVTNPKRTDRDAARWGARRCRLTKELSHAATNLTVGECGGYVGPPPGRGVWTREVTCDD